MKELSHRGGHIIMCCRNVENGEKAKKEVMKCVPKARIDVRQVDLCSFDNVREFVKSIGMEKKTFTGSCRPDLKYCAIYFNEKLQRVITAKWIS